MLSPAVCQHLLGDHLELMVCGQFTTSVAHVEQVLGSTGRRISRTQIRAAGGRNVNALVVVA